MCGFRFCQKEKNYFQLFSLIFTRNMMVILRRYHKLSLAIQIYFRLHILHSKNKKFAYHHSSIFQLMPSANTPPQVGACSSLMPNLSSELLKTLLHFDMFSSIMLDSVMRNVNSSLIVTN